MAALAEMSEEELALKRAEMDFFLDHVDSKMPSASELMRRIIADVGEPGVTDADKVSSLQLLADLVANIDTAVDFTHPTVGGLPFLSEYLGAGRGADLRAAAFGVLASAASNNPGFVVGMIRGDVAYLTLLLEGMLAGAGAPAVAKKAAQATASCLAAVPELAEPVAELGGADAAMSLLETSAAALGAGGESPALTAAGVRAAQVLAALAPELALGGPEGFPFVDEMAAHVAALATGAGDWGARADAAAALQLALSRAGDLSPAGPAARGAAARRLDPAVKAVRARGIEDFGACTVRSVCGDTVLALARVSDGLTSGRVASPEPLGGEPEA